MNRDIVHRPLERLRSLLVHFRTESVWARPIGKGLVSLLALSAFAVVGSIHGARASPTPLVAAIGPTTMPAPSAAPSPGPSLNVAPEVAPLPAPSLAVIAQTRGASAGATEREPVYLNEASLSELRRLPGIGEKRAQAILALRERMGRLRQVEDLLKVKGVGRAMVKRLRPLVRFDAPAPRTSAVPAPSLAAPAAASPAASAH